MPLAMEYQWCTLKDYNGEHFLKRYFEFLFFAILKQMLKQLFLCAQTSFDHFF